MTKLLDAKRSKELWDTYAGLARPLEKIEDPDEVAAIRKQIDDWSDSRAFQVDNLGSLIKLDKLSRRHVLVAHLKFLFVTRQSWQESAPYKGEEFTMVAPPQTLFHLPYHPPPKFEKGKEKEIEVLGNRKVASCEVCKGKGELRCDLCGGQGEVRCKTCGGSGRITEKVKTDQGGHEQQVTCANCKGSKTTDCKRCDRTGWVQCKTCEGYSKILTRTFVSTDYEPERYTDVLYRGEFPARKLADLKVRGRTIIVSPIFRLDLSLTNTPGPWLEKFQANPEAQALMPYLNALDKEFGDRITSETKIFEMHVDIRDVPLIEVPYTYDGKDYTLYLYGEDQAIYAKSSPSAVGAFLGATFGKIKGLFKKEDEEQHPAEVIIEACIWMCWADGKLHPNERELIFGFIREADLDQEKKNRLGKMLEKECRTFAVGDRLPDHEDRKECARFCWQVAVSDEDIDPSEEQSMNELCAQLGLSEEEVADIKREAEADLVIPQHEQAG